MNPGIDPTVDYAFKRLFGVPQTRDLLISLIEAVMEPPPEQRIVELDLLNPFNDRESPTDKLSILDIKARDQMGRQFNIEMQMISHAFLRERVLYYWAKFHQQQIQQGDRYQVLRPTVCICFTRGALFPNVADYRLQFMLREREREFVFSDQLAIYTVELGKFDRAANQLTSAPLDRWAWFLKHGAELDAEAVPETLEAPEIYRALEELRMFSQTELERDQYEARLKWIRDEEAAHDSARMEGLQEGLADGVLIGRIQLAQSLLGEPQTPTAELCERDPAALRALADDLEQRCRTARNDNGAQQS